MHKTLLEMKVSLWQCSLCSACFRWGAVMDLENSKPEDVVFSHAFLRIETPKKKSSRAWFKNWGNCALMIQDQWLWYVLSSNYMVIPTFKHSFSTAGFGQYLFSRQPALSVRACVRLGVFGDICEGELLMQCKSNLPRGRCAAFCLLCVCLCVCLCVWDIVREEEGAVLQLKGSTVCSPAHTDTAVGIEAIGSVYLSSTHDH